MKVYIIKETPGNPVGEDDLRIIKVQPEDEAADLRIISVQPEDEAAFMQQYGSKIILEGSSIHEVLIKFNQYVHDHDQ